MISRIEMLTNISKCDIIYKNYKRVKHIMALIICSECGKEVSDKSQNCVHCGAPIAGIDEAKIKIYHWYASTMWKAKECEVDVLIGNKVVWSGASGSIAILKIEKKENIHILAKKCAANGPFVYTRDINLDFVVEPGKKYEIFMAQASFLNDQTKSKYSIREVEVIDTSDK